MLNQCIVHVDGKSAWRAPIAGFIVQFLLMGFTRAISLLLLGIGEDFDVSKTVLLSTAIVAMALEKLLAPAAERMAHLFGAKMSILTSTVIAFTSISVCYFLPLTEAVIVGFLGVGTGIAGALSPVPVYSATAQALKKRRGLGISLVKSGVSLGAMCFPPLMVLFMDNYGTRGAIIIIAGIILNGLVAVVLLPSAVIDKKTGKAVSSDPQFTCSCTKEMNESNDAMVELNPKSTENRRTSRARIIAEKKPLIARIPLIVYYCFMIMCSMTCFSQMVNVYPMFLDELGLEKYVIAAAISLQGFVDLGFRFVIGFLADKLTNRGRLLSMSVLMGSSGCFTLILGLVHFNVGIVISFCVMFGMGIAQLAVGWIPIMVGFTDITYLPRFMSWTLTLVGIMSLLFISFINKILKEMNSYRPLIIIYGCLTMVCALNTMISALIFERCRYPVSSETACDVEEPDSQ